MQGDPQAGIWGTDRQAGCLQPLLARAVWGACTATCTVQAHRQESYLTDLAPSVSTCLVGQVNVSFPLLLKD